MIHGSFPGLCLRVASERRQGLGLSIVYDALFYSVFSRAPGSIASRSWSVVKHACHAAGCSTPVPPEKLFCLDHWRLLPLAQKREIRATYRPGQCEDKRPSMLWISAARRAIAAVKAREQEKEG